MEEPKLILCKMCPRCTYLMEITNKLFDTNSHRCENCKVLWKLDYENGQHFLYESLDKNDMLTTMHMQLGIIK